MNNHVARACARLAEFRLLFSSLWLRTRRNPEGIHGAVARLHLLPLFALALCFSFCQRSAAQISPRDSSAARLKWNGRDAVIHRPGDWPYSLYHLSRPYPHVVKQPKEICNYYAFYTGMWIPTGRDRVLGSHPLLGMNFGQWINRFTWDLNLELQLGGTSTAYQVVYNGHTTSSNLYGGTYVGLNFGYSLFSVKKSVVYLTGGIGGTDFTAVRGDDNNNGLSISSFTRNCGLGLHHFGKNGNLFAATLLYNFVGYQNPGGTPIDGNAVTLRLSFGAFE